MQRIIGKGATSFERGEDRRGHLTNPLCGLTSVAEILENVFERKYFQWREGGKNGSVSPFDPRALFPNTNPPTTHMASAYLAFTRYSHKSQLGSTCVWHIQEQEKYLLKLNAHNCNGEGQWSSTDFRVRLVKNVKGYTCTCTHSLTMKE